jgi:GT2 family glycosyltransferase
LSQKEQPFVAVIILNYNGRHWLEQFLPSVVRHTPSRLARIWVADNASTDDSIDLVKQHFPTVSTLKMPENYGYAGGYNQAIHHIKAKYILLLNSDVEVSEGWLTPLVRCLDENPNVAACQPKILSWHEPRKFEYAGAAGGFIDKFGYPFCRGRIFDTTEEDYGQYNQSTEIFWASGACMLVKRDLFELSGGFDVDFFAHMEEIDLCWKLKNLGYAIRYVPDSKVYHVGGGTLSTQSTRKIFLNFRNNRLMLFKNMQVGEAFMVNFIRNFLDIMAILKHLSKMQWKEAAAIIKAHWAYLKLLNVYSRKRAITDHLIRDNKIGVPNKKGIYPKSIVWAYFFRKKKYFRQLNW